jgi:hypothetical protein
MRLVPAPLAAFAIFAGAVACGSVPDETQPQPFGNLVPPAGVIRGNVVYSGPHPCSSNGHIIGNAVVLVFDRRNPPPPNGLASTAVNFGVVEGDVLFANEPRNTGTDRYCPEEHGVTGTITVSGPFAIAPMDPGSFILASFFDYEGDFLPTFKIRQLPEQFDVAGGDIDTADALKAVNAGNPNYQAHFLPVDVGIAQPLPPNVPPSLIPNFTMPADGFVADNVTVTVGQVLPYPRPYFYPQGADVAYGTSKSVQQGPPTLTGVPQKPDLGSVDLGPPVNANYAPILTIPQDLEVYAPPQVLNKANVDNWESRFPHLTIVGGLPPAETAKAVAAPFHFQQDLTMQRPSLSSLRVWQNASLAAATQTWTPLEIPEGFGVPQLWPLVVLTKLVDDAKHQTDPASLTQQGSATAPVVVLQAITLYGTATLFDTIQAAAQVGGLFDATGRPKVFVQDQLTALLRPNVICFDTLFDPKQPDKHGVIVGPYKLGLSADLPNGKPNTPIAPPTIFMNPQITALVQPHPIEACMPPGRYAINLIYPDGQAWTVPNEAGACSGTEGSTNYGTLTCSVGGRSVLRSQGPRAVVEIVATSDPNHCTGAFKVPAQCQTH